MVSGKGLLTLSPRPKKNRLKFVHDFGKIHLEPRLWKKTFFYMNEVTFECVFYHSDPLLVLPSLLIAVGSALNF